MQGLPIIVLILMIATVVALVAGLVLMAVGGKENKKHSNKLMVARVGLQAMALLMLLLMFFFA